MDKRKNIKFLAISALFFSLLSFSCVNPLAYLGSAEENGIEDDPFSASRQIVEDSSFTIAWDAPDDAEVNGYRVYYRIHNDTVWTMLEEIDEYSTEYTVSYPELEYGEYEFAVTALSSDGESDYHTSLDTTALPDIGWFLDWREA